MKNPVRPEGEPGERLEGLNGDKHIEHFRSDKKRETGVIHIHYIAIVIVVAIVCSSVPLYTAAPSKKSAAQSAAKRLEAMAAVVARRGAASETERTTQRGLIQKIAEQRGATASSEEARQSGVPKAQLSAEKLAKIAAASKVTGSQQSQAARKALAALAAQQRRAQPETAASSSYVPIQFTGEITWLPRYEYLRSALAHILEPCATKYEAPAASSSAVPTDCIRFADKSENLVQRLNSHAWAAQEIIASVHESDRDPRLPAMPPNLQLKACADSMRREIDYHEKYLGGKGKVFESLQQRRDALADQMEKVAEFVEQRDWWLHKVWPILGRDGSGLSVKRIERPGEALRILKALQPPRRRRR